MQVIANLDRNAVLNEPSLGVAKILNPTCNTISGKRTV